MKVVLTGVSRGLGRAMATEFAAANCKVIGCARNADGVKDLARSLAAPHEFSLVDVSSNESVAAWAASVLETNGAPDFVINNAAAINRNAPLWKISAVEFERLTAININGTANVIRHFLPAMIKQGRGVVVNFSSGWGRSVSADVAPYCATKWAIEGLTQALAAELPPGMAAIPLNPGIINTDMLKSCFGEAAETYPRAEEWAQRAVPFILSLTSAQNGTPLTVS